MQKCLDRYSVSSWRLKGWRNRSLLEASASEETTPESGSMALGSKDDSVGPVWSLQQRVSIKQRAGMLQSSYANCQVRKPFSQPTARSRNGISKGNFNKELVTQTALLLNWVHRSFWFYDGMKQWILQIFNFDHFPGSILSHDTGWQQWATTGVLSCKWTNCWDSSVCCVASGEAGLNVDVF